ncbi:MAG: ABC transporter ATP-binding protein [Oligoflexia bacterium]|nr:ABC transporter ATP-binding protein [Oligoflexia bacterium]
MTTENLHAAPAGGVGITVRELRKRLGVNQALDGLSLEFNAGIMHGLIGPEGAGKTTLLRTLLGLLRADSGELRYTDSGAQATLAQLRPGIAYLPQQQSLYPDLSIAEHLEFFRDLYGIPAELFARRRSELLSITRLEKFQDRPAGKLSGGMYKKLGLMCALLRSPRVMLLDEPTNGVDPISRREFWELLHGLADQRILIIVATAYMDEAERCAEVHLIESGRRVAEGEPLALLREAGVQAFDELFLKRAEAHEGSP